LRIICDCSSNANNHDIHQRPQPVQVLDTSRTIDVLRMSGSRCNTSVQRLTDLTNDYQIVDRPPTQRREDICPDGWEKLVPVAEQVNEIPPALGRRELLADGEVELHCQIKIALIYILNATIGHPDTKITRFLIGNDSGTTVLTNSPSERKFVE
jgi:hypothetical protein